jgi:endogenous inhibitor of DNA gyrase (YacG/DUF329 family)
MSAAPKPPLCVYCRKRPVDPAWRPFCSERCQTLDLAQWADGAYRVPGARDDNADDEDEESS